MFIHISVYKHDSIYANMIAYILKPIIKKVEFYKSQVCLSGAISTCISQFVRRETEKM